jgi:chromosome segregation ATPase
MSTILAIADSTTPSSAPNDQPSRLSQLEQLLKQGRVYLQDLRTRLEETTKERDELRIQLSEAIAARDRLDDRLREAEERRASLEKALASAIDDIEQLRADADRAAALAREIFEIHQR